MNTTVQATGMTVTAKSDNIFLQIKNSSNESTNPTKTAAEAVSSAATLNVTDYKTVSSSGVTWGSKFSTDPNSVAYADRASLGTIDAGEVGQFVWHDTFSFWVNVNAAHNTGSNLHLANVTVENAGTNDIEEALRVLIVGPDGAILWANTGASENSSAVLSSSGIAEYASGSTTLLSEVPEGEASAVALDVYIYFCGNDDSVYTNGVANLANLTVSLTFAVAE